MAQNATQLENAQKNHEQDEDMRSPEHGAADEYRNANAWLRKNYSDKEANLQIHLVLVELLAVLGKKK